MQNTKSSHLQLEAKHSDQFSHNKCIPSFCSRKKHIDDHDHVQASRCGLCPREVGHYCHLSVLATASLALIVLEAIRVMDLAERVPHRIKAMSFH